MDPTPFGHYQLHELIGQGGMGEVYRAYDTTTDRIVALKVLPHNLADDQTYQVRFRRESQAAAALTDPHVVPIHGFGEIDGLLYLDMRLIEGRNLGTILANTDKPLGTDFAIKVVEQVAAALDDAHDAGLIHRDVKPSNILVTPREFVYLIDFGLARSAGEPGLTTAGRTLGTLAYMAPERFEGGKVDGRADIYALTCVLYECLTGLRPYPQDSLEQQIAGHMVSPPPRPSDTDPRLAAFDEVIAKGMAKRPENRYQTAAALAVAARRAKDAPVRRAGRGRHSAHRPLPPARRRRSGRALATAVAVIVLVLGCAFAAWQLRSEPEPTDHSPGLADRGSPSTLLGTVESIAATLPEEIKGRGHLVVGVNVPYAPNEFKNAGGQIVGFDVDLMNAVARTLGLTAEYREAPFDDIIPSVQSGEFDLGMSSVTDTVDREQLVDFVTYFQAGTMWAQRSGSSIDPNAACGLKVGVVTASLQETVELPAKRDACVAAGLSPIEIIVHTNQDDVTKALIAGDVDAMSADSPVTGFAIKLSAGALAPAGAVFDSAPYGWPVARGSVLAESLRQALEHLIKTGEYRTIATIWGVEPGLIDNPVINGAGR